MNEWNIQSRAHGCQTCEQPFADKQPYYTLLFAEKSELRRLDICEGCWKARFAPEAAAQQGLISRWQGLYETPPAAPPDAIQKETAETLLRKLIEQNDPKHGAACYILAVMLERKRLLKVKEQFKRDGQRFFVYEHPKTADVFMIADPNLQLNQLEEVQRDVADLLENGLGLPVAAIPATPPAEGTAPETATTEAGAEVAPEAGANPEVAAVAETTPEAETPAEPKSESAPV